MARGVFIVFEGPEGAGKSTQAARLAEALRRMNLVVTLTREPGGTRISEQIRTVLLDNSNYDMLAETEALLHSAARAQHVGQLIRPALESGSVVVCDRFVDSTIAYQGGGRGLPVDPLRMIQAFATGGLSPDLRILLDLPVAEGFARTNARGDRNRLDMAEKAFHEAVRSAFLGAARADPGSWSVIDGMLCADDIHALVLAAVMERTELSGRRAEAGDMSLTATAAG